MVFSIKNHGFDQLIANSISNFFCILNYCGQHYLVCKPVLFIVVFKLAIQNIFKIHTHQLKDVKDIQDHMTDVEKLHLSDKTLTIIVDSFGQP